MLPSQIHPGLGQGGPPPPGLSLGFPGLMPVEQPPSTGEIWPELMPAPDPSQGKGGGWGGNEMPAPDFSQSFAKAGSFAPAPDFSQGKGGSWAPAPDFSQGGGWAPAPDFTQGKGGGWAPAPDFSQGKGGDWGGNEAPKRPKLDDSGDICEFYAKGFCGFGDKCYKRHAEDPNKKEPCPFFQKGFCGFGDKCFKSHDPMLNAMSFAPAAPKEVCKYYLNGFCGFGEECVNAHVGTPKSSKSWGKPGGGGGGAAGGASDKDISQQVQIPARRVKDLMGLQGGNIRKITQMSGVYKIKIVDEEDSKSKDPNELVAVEIRGHAPAVEVACKMVLQVAEGDQSCIGHIEISMEIEPRLVSKIIGTKGEVIQQMQKQSGVRLAVRGGERGTNQLPKLMMTGPPENVYLAKSMVEEYIKAHADKPSQDTHTTFGDQKEDNPSWPWQAPSFLTGGSIDGDVAADDLAAAAAATMSGWPGQASSSVPALPGLPIPGGGLLPGGGSLGAPGAAPPLDFEAFSAQAMAAAQQMAMANVQQMLIAQQMQAMAQPAAAAAAAEPAAGAPPVDDTQWKSGAAKMATSLREKMLASRKRQAEGST